MLRVSREQLDEDLHISMKGQRVPSSVPNPKYQLLEKSQRRGREIQNPPRKRKQWPTFRGGVYEQRGEPLVIPRRTPQRERRRILFHASSIAST